jgi:hypothetical protein
MTLDKDKTRILQYVFENTLMETLNIEFVDAGEGF